jgi:hypothetical protein
LKLITVEPTIERLDLAIIVLEKAASYESDITNCKDVSPEEVEFHQKLSSEYFVIRTLLVRSRTV